MKTYTTPEVSKLTGNLSRERLRQIRNGYKTTIKLIKGIDWDWKDGDIVWKHTAVRKLVNNRKKRLAKNSIRLPALAPSLPL
jgi:hypothetical protein